MIYFFLNLEINNFWKEITRNQFTAQPQRDKHASSMHNSRSNTMQINPCLNKCCFALGCKNYRTLSGLLAQRLAHPPTKLQGRSSRIFLARNSLKIANL